MLNIAQDNGSIALCQWHSKIGSHWCGKSVFQNKIVETQQKWGSKLQTHRNEIEKGGEEVAERKTQQQSQFCYSSVPVQTPSLSYHIHVDAVSVRPSVLEVLLQPLPQWVWDLVEADEFFDPQHLEVIPGCTWIQPLDDGGHISKDAGVH